jgi:hypothetical protein
VGLLIDCTTIHSLHTLHRYAGWDATSDSSHLGFRYGQWKYVRNSRSCGNADCKVPMLFDLSSDIGEHTDVSTKFPAVFSAIKVTIIYLLV